VLGRLIPDAFLGGTMQLDVERASEAVSRIAQSLGTSLEEAALGIIRIANANMEAAIRVISVERGGDPRLFTLVAFGGAGPLHACELAAALRIPRVLIPATPGVLSALGMLVADTLKDYVRTVMTLAEDARDVVSSAFTALEEQGRHDLVQEGIAAEQIVIERFLDLRYKGQSYELTIPFVDDITQAVNDFHSTHERRFGYSDPRERVQVVNVRLKARGLTASPVLERLETTDAAVEPVMTREVVFGNAHGVVKHMVPIYERTSLRSGATLAGPAIVTQYDTTTVLPPEWHGRVDAVGNLIIELAEERETAERTSSW
jgi:N-methylhydantoinase A